MKRGCLNFFVDEACDNLLPDDVTFVKVCLRECINALNRNSKAMLFMLGILILLPSLPSTDQFKDKTCCKVCHQRFDWRNERVFLHKKGISTIAVDLRGHGKSGRPKLLGDYNIEKFAGDIHSIIKKEKIIQNHGIKV